MPKSMTLSRHLNIPAVELQSRKIALVSDAVVVEDGKKATVFSFSLPEEVSISASDENLIWWALSFKVQNRFGRKAFNNRDLKVVRMDEPKRKAYQVTSC